MKTESKLYYGLNSQNKDIVLDCKKLPNKDNGLIIGKSGVGMQFVTKQINICRGAENGKK